MAQGLYYKRDGTLYKEPNAVLKWGKDHQNRDIKIVKQEELENGYFISTVWLGIDHRFGEGKPLIFETMVFPPDSYQDQDMEHYSTEKEAIKGHKKMVSKWKNKLTPKGDK